MGKNLFKDNFIPRKNVEFKSSYSIGLFIFTLEKQQKQTQNKFKIEFMSWDSKDQKFYSVSWISVMVPVITDVEPS